MTQWTVRHWRFFCFVQEGGFRVQIELRFRYGRLLVSDLVDVILRELVRIHSRSGRVRYQLFQAR